MTTPSGVHTEHEDAPWTIQIGNHPGRQDSPIYKRSRKTMIAAVQAAQPWFFGDRPYQDHHGGGVWVLDSDQKPLLFLLPAGIEWSAQFAAAPAKVEALRVMAEALVAAFPATEQWYLSLGMTKGDLKILHTPIKDANGVAAWTDSFWNASVPLPAVMHTGVLPKGAGYHHYPKPIVDIVTFKRDDFNLFVTDEDGHPLAVAPAGPDEKSRTLVLWAHPDSKYAARVRRAHTTGKPVVLGPRHTASRQAFAGMAR